jgi:hypothetical protein
VKVAATRNGPAFEPITLTLTLESLEEAASVHAAFNFHPLCLVIEKHLAVDAIRDRIAEALPGVQLKSTELHNKVVESAKRHYAGK